MARRKDENQIAFAGLQELIRRDAQRDGIQYPEKAAIEEQPRKSRAAIRAGRKGGKKGGPARAQKLTAAERTEIARTAARARWNKKP